MLRSPFAKAMTSICTLQLERVQSNVVGDTNAAAPSGFFKQNSTSARLTSRSITSELSELTIGGAHDFLLLLSNSLEHVLFDRLVGKRLPEAKYSRFVFARYGCTHWGSYSLGGSACNNQGKRKLK
ncbi:hypothetical protein R1flu_008262 [Riccia fluitans]|uniref:Uncharacterized protein n=1 Tax=Riccia fluitans TaxID=41844 RepID=A0ABD1YER8_9MARC